MKIKRIKEKITSAKFSIPIAGTLTALLGIYFILWEPDIRLISFKPAEMTIDASKGLSNNSAAITYTCIIPFTNFSIKPGYIDSVEVIKLGIPKADVEIEAKHFYKENISYNSKYLFKISLDVYVKKYYERTKTELDGGNIDKLQLRFYDNLGHLILSETGKIGFINIIMQITTDPKNFK